jgi:SNF2 family DNA or RNA helicase
METETEACPIITDYTRSIGLQDKTLEKLWRVRQHDPADGPIAINVGPLLKTDWPLKNYQTQAVAHLMLIPRMVIGDAVGLGKTMTAIAGIAYHTNKDPKLKTLVITTKSVARQFAKEVTRFSTLSCHTMKERWEKKTSHEGRMLQVKMWLEDDGPSVLVTKYSSLIGRRKTYDGPVDDNGDPVGKNGKELISQEIQDLVAMLWPHREHLLVIFDECHKLKNPEAQTRISMMQIQRCALRVWGLSASLIKNGADELYAVISAMGIRPHQSLDAFKEKFCVYEMQQFGYKRVFKLIGYKNMKEFKSSIRPFVYGRSQRQVKEPLPRLTTRFHELDLDDKQYKLLTKDIPEGRYTLPPGIRKIAGELALVDRDPSNMMTMLSVYQLVANHPCLLEAFDEEKLHTKTLSPKEEALLDLLEGDLDGEKVIVFTKYKTWINRLEWLIKKKGLSGRRFLRITGDENEAQREAAMDKFQGSNDYNLIVINTAAMEGVNLQQAAHMVCLDLPWSWGDLIQLVGRMLRLASPHSACTLHAMVMRGTVDEYVVTTLLGKKGVFESILGESHSAGLLESELKEIDLESGIDRDLSDAEFITMLKAHTRDVPMGKYLSGDLLKDSREKVNYKTSYEKRSDKKARGKSPLKTPLNKLDFGEEI